MLILQRRKGEALCIGDDVKITVSDVGNDWVKIAVDAPKEISILRSELVEAANENKEAYENSSSKLIQEFLKGNK